MTTTTKRGPGRPPKAQGQQANGQVALSLEANGLEADGLEAPEPTPDRSPGQAARKPKAPKPERSRSLETWIWDAACSIRGAKDAPKYKDYILPLILTKRLCDVFDDELDRIDSGDMFKNPKFREPAHRGGGGRLKTFDRVVANPTWNQDWYPEADYANDEWDRFPSGAGFPGKASAVFVGACPASNAGRSRFPLQLRARIIGLAGF